MQFGVRPRMEGSRFFPAGKPLVLTIPPQPAPPEDQPTKPGDKWTGAECAIVRELARLGTRELLRRLPGRTRAGVHNKAQELGVAIAMVRVRGYKVMSRRGRMAIPRHCHPLVREFFREANAQKKTFAELEGAGLGSGTVRDWATKMPRLDTFVAALNHIGLDLRIVHKRPKSEQQIKEHLSSVIDDDFGLVLARVAAFRDVTVESILSGSRQLTITLARDECIWLARRYMAKSYPQLARMLAMDHSSVIAAARRHQKRIDAAREKRRGG